MNRASVLQLLVAAVLIGFAVSFMGCGGGSDGLARTNTTLGVVAGGAEYAPSAVLAPSYEATPPLLVIGLPNDETVEIDQANIGIEDIDLETAEEVAQSDVIPTDDDDGDDDDGIDLDGPYIADIINEVLRNIDGTVALNTNTYFVPGTIIEEAELDIAANSGVCPETGSGVSIHLHGTYRDADGTVIYNFHLDSGIAEELEIDDDEGGGIVVGDNSLLALIFGVGNWFDGVDMSTANIAVVDGNEDVLFNASHNAGLRDAIVNNILATLTLGEDDDDDDEDDDLD